MKPVLFVTGQVPPYRLGGLVRLHELEGLELALFGGRSLHAGPGQPRQIPVPHRFVRPRQLYGLAAGGGYRAVVCPTGGRLAPLATWAGARRGGVPLVLWGSLWAHPRTPAHLFTYLPLRRLYASADAVVTYGEHVSRYVRAHGARNVHVAAQAVDNDFWRAPVPETPDATGDPAPARTRFLFVGRDGPEKGLDSLLAAWRASGLVPPQATLTLVGVAPPRPAPAGVSAVGIRTPLELRRIYASADVLVVPSIATRNFREPWGLVVNEAMNSELAVVASDAVGAVVGGLVRDGQNGLVFAAGDTGALACALRRLTDEPGLRERLAAQGAGDVLAYDHDAWAAGFSRALAGLGVSVGAGSVPGAPL